MFIEYRLPLEDELVVVAATFSLSSKLFSGRFDDSMFVVYTKKKKRYGNKEIQKIAKKPYEIIKTFKTQETESLILFTIHRPQSRVQNSKSKTEKY